MKQYKGDRLYVNLGPSKVRRMLKGHGFGVKKVQSAGTGQSVIIHTATGEHLRQLRSLFGDAAAPVPVDAAAPVPVDAAALDPNEAPPQGA